MVAGSACGVEQAEAGVVAEQRDVARGFRVALVLGGKVRFHVFAVGPPTL